MRLRQQPKTSSLSSEKQELYKLGLLLFIAAILIFTIAYTYNFQITEDQYNSDFFTRWYATKKLLQEGRNLYAWDNGEEVLQYWTFEDAEAVQGLFFYPAYLLLFILPLSLLPYPLADLLWASLIQVFFVAGLLIFYRLTGWPSSVNKFSLFLLAALGLWPNILHTTWEQFNSIGLLGWALMFWAVWYGHYGWAGIAAGLLIFKPQHTFFILLFYMIWMLRRPAGWRFYVAFGSTIFGLWLFGELFQPGWVFEFINSIQDYQNVPEGVSSVSSDLLGNSLWSSGIGLLWVMIVWKQKGAEPSGVQFWGLQAFSLGIGLFIVPIVGMWHAIILYPAIILIAAAWQQRSRCMHHLSLIAYLMIPVMGFVVVAVAFLFEILLIWGEEPKTYLYRNIGAILTIVLSLPLSLKWSIRGDPGQPKD